MKLPEAKDATKLMIPVTLIGTIIAMVTGGVWFASNLKHELETSGLVTKMQLQQIELRIEQVVHRFDNAATREEIENWVLRTNAANPDLTIPDFEH